MRHQRRVQKTSSMGTRISENCAIMPTLKLWESMLPRQNTHHPSLNVFAGPVPAILGWYSHGDD